MSPDTTIDVATIRAAIENEVVGYDEETKKQYLKQFEREITDFLDRISLAYVRWQEFDAQIGDNSQKAFVSAYLFNVINNLVVSMRLLISGFYVAGGNLVRHAIESCGAAILCSRCDYPFCARIQSNRYSIHRALHHVRRNSTSLAVNRDSLAHLVQARDFYDAYSHATAMSLSTTMAFDDEGKACLGAYFDEGKIAGYEKEFGTRLNMALIIPNLIEGIRQNGQWTENE
jgi:hypothetical protein